MRYIVSAYGKEVATDSPEDGEKLSKMVKKRKNVGRDVEIEACRVLNG